MQKFLYEAIWWLINFDILLVGGIIIAAYLLYTRWWKGGRRIIATFAVLLILVIIIPWPRWTVTYLENYYTQPQRIPEDAQGIIFLGGSFDFKNTKGRKITSYNLAAGRYFAFIELAKQNPHLKLVFTGGGAHKDPKLNEGYLTKQLFKNIGFDDSNMIYETNAKNTIENAYRTYKLIKPKPGEKWLLVTSAFHMPRSVGLFHKVGWDITPYPVDYHTPGTYDFTVDWRLNTGFLAWKVASREIIGMLKNYMCGDTTAIFPPRDLQG